MTEPRHGQLRGTGATTERRRFLQDQDGETGTGEMRRSREAVRPRTDHDHVVAPQCRPSSPVPSSIAVFTVRS